MLEFHSQSSLHNPRSGGPIIIPLARCMRHIGRRNCRQNRAARRSFFISWWRLFSFLRRRSVDRWSRHPRAVCIQCLLLWLTCSDVLTSRPKLFPFDGVSLQHVMSEVEACKDGEKDDHDNCDYGVCCRVQLTLCKKLTILGSDRAGVDMLNQRMNRS